MKRYHGILKLFFVIILSIFFSTASFAETDITIEEQTLVDEQGVKIIAKSYGETFDDPYIALSIQNDTDSALTFTLSRTSVNGIMLKEATLYETVEPGSISSASIGFLSYALEDNGIETIGEIETAFSVSKKGSNDTLFETAVATIKTSAYGTFTQQYDESGDVLVDEAGVKVIKKEPFIMDAISGQYYYVVNDSDKRIRIVATNNVVNGISIPGDMTYRPIEIGKRCRESFSFFNSDLKKVGINNITSSSSEFVFYDVDTDQELFRKAVSFSGNDTGMISAPSMVEGMAYSDPYVEVSLSGLKIENMGNSSLDLSIRNCSSEDLRYSFGYLYVNGKKTLGTSGKSAYGHDYLVQINPSETYDTTVTIYRDDLMENSISEIQSISLELHFMVGFNIHDITVDVPFNNGASSSTSIGGDISKVAEDYIVKTHFITSDDNTLYALYELKNPNSVPVSLVGEISFKDDAGKVLDTGEDNIEYMGSEAYQFMIFSTKSGATKMTITLKPAIQNKERAKLHYDEENADSLKVKVTNVGDRKATGVRLTVVFLKNGRVNGFSQGLNGMKCVSLMPGESAVKESNQSYDKYLLYFDGVME